MFELPKGVKRPRSLTVSETEALLNGEEVASLPNLKDFLHRAFGKISVEDADRMSRFIEAGCERIDG